MSGHSTYQPTNGFTRWLESRLPIIGLVHSSFVTFPTPKNLNYWYTFGGILSMCLVVQLITGIVLVMHYTPHADFAFASVEHIMRDVNYGWLMRYMHANGASMFFIAVYIHMFRGLYYGSYKAPREVLWIIGVLIYLAMMATGFMGYVLPWGQMSFWGAKVITNLFSAIPFVGESVVVWLWGGFSVDNPTLNRFFSLHYLLPFVIAGLVVLHIWALHVVGNNNPLGVDVKSEKDTVPFSPYYTVKDGFAMVCFIIFFAYFVFFNPNMLGHTDNYIEANPLVTPAHIVPEWYYLPFYAILRAVPDKLGGVLLMFAAIGILFLLPWLDTSKVRSATFRPLYKQFFVGFVLVCIGLGWVGAKSPDLVLIENADTQSYASAEAAEQAAETLRAQIAEMKEKDETPDFEVKLESSVSGHSVKKVYSSFTMLHLGRILTALYFLFFFPVLPLLGLLEKPKAIPASINEAVLAKSKAGGGSAGATASGATTAPDKNA